MACSRPASAEDGYATPAAIVISLSLAVLATAISDRSLAALELARADMERTRAELALDGAQQEAALKILQTPRAAPLRWTTRAGSSVADVVAEPEAPKLSLDAAAALDDATLAKMGVRDRTAARARFQALVSEDDADAALEGADPSQIWRRCARSWIGQDGLATAIQPINPQHVQGDGSSSGRSGEVWRIRIGYAGGWVDDRTVRFTGDLVHPARVIRRRLFKSNLGGAPCDVALGQLAAR